MVTSVVNSYVLPFDTEITSLKLRIPVLSSCHVAMQVLPRQSFIVASISSDIEFAKMVNEQFAVVPLNVNFGIMFIDLAFAACAVTGNNSPS